MSDRGERGAGTLLLLIAAVLLGSAEARAQDGLDALVARCGGGSASLEASCREGALALQAAQGAAGALATGGAQVPGAASTLGRRFGGTPRFSLALTGRVARGSVPDVRQATPSSERSFTGLTAQGTLALGLLDGFSLLPTVGGILSLDAFANAGVGLLPGGAGFGSNPTHWGLGARLGLLRESFTLPGVTLSGAWRGGSSVALGSRAAGDALEAEVDPRVISIRGVAGKDLLALGVLAGLGWDRYGGDGRIAVPGGQASGSALESERWLYFAGVSLNLLLLQLSAEGGWAGGFGEVPGRAQGGYDPTAGTLFFSLAGRLTL